MRWSIDIEPIVVFNATILMKRTIIQFGGFIVAVKMSDLGKKILTYLSLLLHVAETNTTLKDNKV